MKRLFLISFVLLLIAGVAILADTSSVFAQGDNGTATDDTEYAENWCLGDGSWADERCDNPDIWVSGWYYICGYYMAQVEAGIWPKGPEGQLVSDGCLVPLPPLPPPPPSPNAIADTPEITAAITCSVILSTLTISWSTSADPLTLSVTVNIGTPFGAPSPFTSSASIYSGATVFLRLTPTSPILASITCPIFP